MTAARPTGKIGPRPAIQDEGRTADRRSRAPLAGHGAIVRPPTAEAEERRDLNDVVHSVLIVGLAISTVLLVLGVALSLIEHRPMPDSTIPVGEAARRALGLRPSGFLAIGLLVLILTPVLRVIGSLFVFLYVRDWRYVCVTALVLAIMLMSLLSGHA